MADYDVLIIGAGIAGLTVARELRGSGLRIALLDARDRVGGRAWFQTWHGYPIEMGGGWVNWTQPHVWAEITRYGLDLFERPGWPKRADAPLCAEVDGELITRPMVDNMRALRPLIEDYAHDARRVFPRPYDPAHAMEAIAEIDHLSAQDRLDQIDMPPLQRAMMSRLLAMQCHGHPRDGAYVEFLRWYALNHFSIDAYLSSASRLQFSNGTQGLLDALLADTDAEVKLEWPVDRVAQSEQGVVVTHSNGAELSARAAVVATPINLWKQIHFRPTLSEAKRALSQAEHTGKGQKLYVRVSGHWPELNLAADADAAISTVIVQEASEDETLLVVMLVNDQLAPYTQTQIQ
ncbi:MAG: NAD(P)/FAD-dependent oxidoreductase, partial [Pseudomonadota bacterium]